MTVDDSDAIAILDDDGGNGDRSITLESAAWLVAFTLLIGAAVGGLLVHGIQGGRTRPVAAAPTTVVRTLVIPTPVTTRTAVAHKTLYVRKTVTRSPTPTPTPTLNSSAPSAFAGASGPVVSTLNALRAHNFDTTASLREKARACARTNARTYRQQTCTGAAWSAVLSGDGLTDSAFAKAVIDQPDGAWRTKQYQRAAAASASAKNGRVFWVLILS